MLAIFRELAFTWLDLVQLAEAVDARLAPDLEVEDFVTVLLARVCAGRGPPGQLRPPPPALLASAAAGLQFMTPDRPEPPLGLRPRPARQDVTLKPGLLQHAGDKLAYDVLLILSEPVV